MKKIIFLFIIISTFIYANDFQDITVIIRDSDNRNIENASVIIGDLELTTNENGEVSIILFPATYGIRIAKSDYYPIDEKLIVTSDQFSYTYHLESKILPTRLEIFDSLTENRVALTVEMKNLNNEKISIITPDENNIYNLSLNKEFEYEFYISHEIYEEISFDINPKNLEDASLRFDINRKTSRFSLSSNVNNGNIKFILKENQQVIEDINFEESIETNLPYGEFDIVVTSNRYEELKSAFSLTTESKSIEVELEAKFGYFNFLSILEISNEINFYESFGDLEDRIELRNPTKIELYQENDLIKEFEVFNESVAIDLDFGEYQIVANNISAKNYEKTIILNENTLPNILIVLEKAFSTIRGSVMVGNSFLGGTEIIFSGEEDGNSYKVNSSIDGSYSLKLPPQTYSLSINRSGYQLVESIPKRITNLSPNTVYNLTIELEEIPSIVTGQITTFRDRPVPDAKITLKPSGEDVKEFYSDRNGNYKAKISGGIVVIKVEKLGYETTGTVKNISKFSTTTDVNFQLRQIVADISGVVTDGRRPIPGLTVFLMQENDEIFATSTTRTNGSYNFNDIPIFRNYNIIINSDEYKSYESGYFLLSETDIENHNVIIEKEVNSIILEFITQDNEILSNIDLKISGKSYTLDSNGILEKVIDSEKNLLLEIPELDFTSEISLINDEGELISNKKVIVDTTIKSENDSESIND